MRLRISTCLFAFCVSSLACAPSLAAESASRTFRVNGKDAQLAHVYVVAKAPASEEPTMDVIYTEKAAASGADVAAAADTGELGAAFVATLTRFGGTWYVFNCNYAHPAAGHGHGWGASGVFELKDASEKNGELRGHLVSVAPTSATGDAVSLDLEVRAKLP